MNEASEVYRFGGAEQGKDEQYFHYLIQKAKLAYLRHCTPSYEKLCYERNELFQSEKKAKLKCDVLQLNSKETIAWLWPGDLTSLLSHQQGENIKQVNLWVYTIFKQR